MKIGILTFNQARNYGAMLQSYALQTYLRDCGANALHIKTSATQENSYKSFISLLRRIVKRRSYSAYKEFSNKLIFYPGEFCETNAEQLNAAFDMFISGSDQVWNITNGMDYMFYQKFVHDRKKASYAASLGISKLDEKWKPLIKKELDTFDYIAVRENTAKVILDEILSKPVQCVVDPVFLLDRDKWDTICGDRIEKKPYIFVYGTQMTMQLEAVVKLLAEKKRMKICSVFAMKGATELDSKIGPSEFINYIKNAEYIVTTSFHCTAFSLIYERPLIEILHSTTGSRASDLLELVEMNDSCIWHDGYNVDKMKWDYTRAREILKTLIDDSKLYIKKLIG